MLIWGPIAGIFAGFFLELSVPRLAMLSYEFSFQPVDPWPVSWIGFGLIGGLIIGFADGVNGRFRKIRLTGQFDDSWRIRSSLYAALFWGLIGGLIFGYFNGLDYGIGYGLIYGIFGGAVGAYSEIRLANPFKFSWRKFKSNLFIGLSVGMLGGLSVGMLGGLDIWLTERLSGWLNVLLIGGLLGGLIFEPSVTTDVPKNLTTQIPNQGIKRASKYASITGLCTGLIGGIFGGIFDGLSGVWLFGLIGGLIGGAAAGVLSADGDNIIKHLTLRLILWLQGHIPWNYARFLDYCHERIFLRKVGGGYIFIHRMLMEHFAEMTDEDIERIVEDTS